MLSMRRLFSTTGSLKGAWALSTGNLVYLSKQQFAGCDTTDSAFTFAEKKRHLQRSELPVKGNKWPMLIVKLNG